MQNGEPCKEKQHRLIAPAYWGNVCAVFTICERAKRPLLCTPQVFEIARDALIQGCAKGECTAPVFTLMPDHAHVVLLGTSEASRIIRAINHFKWKTGIDFHRLKLGVRWQKDYHDSIARGVESWASISRYVALNPVRKGLVENPLEWPFTGSIGYDLIEVIDDAFGGFTPKPIDPGT